MLSFQDKGFKYGESENSITFFDVGIWRGLGGGSCCPAIASGSIAGRKE